MGELAIVAIALLAVSLFVMAVTGVYNRRLAAVASSRRWVVIERTTAHANGTYVAVSLARGRDAMPIGIVNCAADDFDDRLLDLRVRAEDRALVLNRALSG